VGNGYAATSPNMGPLSQFPVLVTPLSLEVRATLTVDRLPGWCGMGVHADQWLWTQQGTKRVKPDVCDETKTRAR
jgi:hypothetical protein